MNESLVSGDCSAGSIDHSSVLFKTGDRAFVVQTSSGVLFGRLIKQ